MLASIFTLTCLSSVLLNRRYLSVPETVDEHVGNPGWWSEESSAGEAGKGNYHLYRAEDPEEQGLETLIAGSCQFFQFSSLLCNTQRTTRQRLRREADPKVLG